MRNALAIIALLLIIGVYARVGIRAEPVEISASPGLVGANVLVADEKMSEFDRYILAIIAVESAGDHKAISSKGAHGLMQITPVAAKEASIQCSLPVITDMRLLLEPRRNVQYGSCYFRFLLDQQNGNYERALIIYNGGFAQLSKYDRGERIALETANYVLQVRRAYSTSMSTMDVGTTN